MSEKKDDKGISWITGAAIILIAGNIMWMVHSVVFCLIVTTCSFIFLINNLIKFIVFRSGSARYVFLIGNLAFKIARKRNCRSLNTHEINISAHTFDHIKSGIAPVLYTCFNCWVIVMPRCIEFEEASILNIGFCTYMADLHDRLCKAHICAEAIPQNIGWLKGELVCFDYH